MQYGCDVNFGEKTHTQAKRNQSQTKYQQQQQKNMRELEICVCVSNSLVQSIRFLCHSNIEYMYENICWQHIWNTFNAKKTSAFLYFLFHHFSISAGAHCDSVEHMNICIDLSKCYSNRKHFSVFHVLCNQFRPKNTQHLARKKGKTQTNANA